MCNMLVIWKEEFIIFQLNLFQVFFPEPSVNVWDILTELKLLSSGHEGKDSPHQSCDQTQHQPNPPQMKQMQTKANLPSDALPVIQLTFSMAPPIYCTATKTTLLNIVLEKNLTSNVFLV